MRDKISEQPCINMKFRASKYSCSAFIFILYIPIFVFICVLHSDLNRHLKPRQISDLPISSMVSQAKT